MTEWYFETLSNTMLDVVDTQVEEGSLEKYKLDMEHPGNESPTHLNNI
jgi:hypothetical protein